MTTVLVTGASGFIAKHIVRQLLDAGNSVRASVRSDQAEADLERVFPGQLDIVRLDLLKDAGWDDAMVGVDAVIHAASPFPSEEPKDRDDLIRPAVQGTLRALRAAQKAGVRRVVITSSCAAIYKDPKKPADEPSTRENWTDPDGPTTTAYEASKTLAERAAWNFVTRHPEMEVTTVQPALVLGDPVDDRVCTSLNYVQRLLAGEDKVLPHLAVPVVHVSDAARVHVLALTHPETIGQRLPAVAGTRTMAELAATLKEEFPDKPIPTLTVPDIAVKVAAAFTPKLSFVAAALGQNVDVDGSDAPRLLSFTYITPEQAAIDSARFLVEQEEASRKA